MKRLEIDWPSGRRQVLHDVQAWIVLRGRKARASGGPPRDGKPQRGPGLRVIEGLVGYELDGDVTIELCETGAVCTLSY